MPADRYLLCSSFWVRSVQNHRPFSKRLLDPRKPSLSSRTQGGSGAGARSRLRIPWLVAALVTALRGAPGGGNAGAGAPAAAPFT